MNQLRKQSKSLRERKGGVSLEAFPERVQGLMGMPVEGRDPQGGTAVEGTAPKEYRGA